MRHPLPVDFATVRRASPGVFLDGRSFGDPSNLIDRGDILFWVSRDYWTVYNVSHNTSYIANEDSELSTILLWKRYTRVPGSAIDTSSISTDCSIGLLLSVNDSNPSFH